MTTKGEWRVSKVMSTSDGSYTGDFRISANGTPKIAIVHVRDVSVNEAKANADLIAAAPYLFDALEQIQEAFVHIPDDMKGNRYRSGIIKHCENMRVALITARYAVDKAK